MKTLYLIGGPMGVGKTAACRILKEKLPASVFLDGDWCWDASPFVVTEETKAMVLDNITHLLRNFLACSAYENVIFCWVMHRQEILDAILSALGLLGKGAAGVSLRVVSLSLVASGEVLTARLSTDIAAGRRDQSAVERSLAYLPLYREMNTEKLDVSALTPAETAEAIAAFGFSAGD